MFDVDGDSILFENVEVARFTSAAYPSLRERIDRELIAHEDSESMISIEDHEAAIADVRKEYSDCVEAAEHDRLQDQFDALQDKYDQLQIDLDNVRGELVKENAERDALKARVAEVEKEREKDHARVTRALSQSQDWRHSADVASASLAASRRQVEVLKATLRRIAASDQHCYGQNSEDGGERSGPFAVIAEDALYRASKLDAPQEPATDPRDVFLPCPICNGIEGCDHTVPERERAAQDAIIAKAVEIMRPFADDAWRYDPVDSDDCDQLYDARNSHLRLYHLRAARAFVEKYGG